MAIMKEWRCGAHGAFESTQPKCAHCGHGHFVKQEIRTAPAYRRKNMKFIDGTLREIADDAGLTDMRNDVKGGESVAARMARARTDDISRPRWGQIPHAAAGFSNDPNAKVPTVTAQSIGFEPTAAANLKLPPVVNGRFNNALAKTVTHGSYNE